MDICENQGISVTEIDLIAEISLYIYLSLNEEDVLKA